MWSHLFREGLKSNHIAQEQTQRNGPCKIRDVTVQQNDRPSSADRMNKSEGVGPYH